MSGAELSINDLRLLSDNDGNIRNMGGTVTAVGCAFTDSNGIGITNENGSVVADRCIFSSYHGIRNSTQDCASGGGSVTATDCRFAGGGVGIDNLYGTVFVDRGSFSRVGVGIQNFTARFGTQLCGTVSVEDSTFEDCTAGISNGNNGPVEVARSTFVAGDTGISNNGGMMDVSNSTFEDNEVASISHYGGALTVASSTFSGSSVGIFHGGGTATVVSTILADNMSNCSAPVIDGGYNLESANTCGFVAPESRHSTLAGLAPTGLADNGGGTRTIALRTSSAAIDPSDICPATDQRYATRPVDGDCDGVARCDIGAFEAQGGETISCSGDCNGDDRVSIYELVSGVNVALGTAAIRTCLAFDRDYDCRVEIQELVSAVGAALNECPSAVVSITPTPTATLTPTVATAAPTHTGVLSTPTASPTTRPTGSALGVHEFQIAGPSSGSGFFATIFGSRNVATDLAGAPLILDAGVPDEHGITSLRLREDARLGVRLDSGVTICFQFHAQGSGGEIDCNGGSAYDVLIEQAGGENAPPATLSTRLGDDAGSGAAFLELSVAMYMAGTGILGDCEFAPFPSPERSALTTARVTSRRGEQSMARQGAPFDCNSWGDGSGSAVLVMGGTAFERLLQTDLASVFQLSE